MSSSTYIVRRKEEGKDLDYLEIFLDSLEKPAIGLHIRGVLTQEYLSPLFICHEYFHMTKPTQSQKCFMQ